MQYTRLIGSLIDECIAASLGGYDVEDVIAGRATGGDLIRGILVRTVCDPRFKSTVRVERAWQDDARDLLEGFAQELMDIRDLTREEALKRMEEFLSRYFFTMIQRVRSRDLGRDIVSTGGGNGTEEKGNGKDLRNVLKEMEGETDEQIAELRFLRSIPPSLKRLAGIIGRSGNDSLVPSGHFLTASKSDISGITTGNDLSNLLPSEIALLAGKETEDIFFRKYVGKKLQVFASASSGGTAPVQRQDGPVIICLDKSGSMEGDPSDVARALTMAVTILAQRKDREVIVVKYGNDEQEHLVIRHLRRQRKELIKFLTYGAAGGNNEDAMFGELFGQILPADSTFTSADILCVSDFGWYPISQPVMQMILDNKVKGMLFYGLDVSGEAYPPDIIDSMWIWDNGKNMCYEENVKKIMIIVR